MQTTFGAVVLAIFINHAHKLIFFMYFCDLKQLLWEYCIYQLSLHLI